MNDLWSRTTRGSQRDARPLSALTQRISKAHSLGLSEQLDEIIAGFVSREILEDANLGAPDSDGE